MREVPPAVMATHRLDSQEAGRLWQWLLRRQGVGSADRYATVAEIAEAALGLHAARLSSPFATVLARARTPEVALRLWHPATHQLVTTVRCMRKTLHTLPLDLAAAAHGATLHYRERDALRQVRNAGLSTQLVARTTAAVQALLAEHGRLAPRHIEERLATGVTTVVAVRLALKLGWERGLFTYRNRSSSWNRELRTFALTAAAHPDLDMNLDRATATERLVAAYFDRYGPASLRDVTWWSGLSRTGVLAALDRIGQPLIALHTPWSPAPLYMFCNRFKEFEQVSAGEPPTAEPVLLAHEDVALKAYAETRTRYLGMLDQRVAFNQIGEALPTIVLAGRVVGTWSWDTRIRAVGLTLVRGHTSPADRAGIRRAAQCVTAALRQGYDDDSRATRHSYADRQPARLVASTTP
ncbi:crosslink repair DNA glycosylase YcaQ family protein [Micromonospora sp. NPDC007271]|uniref:DNA glycosylase AlkZ-like family protein n=1 Tax=Micromonospora sp. NPDC007271 TaxID=3154587 RepID=UPI0033CFEA06